MMKRISIYTIAVLLTALNFGCTKERMAIAYPSSGTYGENILALSNNSILNNVDGYSLSAELGKKAELKIVFINLSSSVTEGPGAVWFYGEGDGWIVGDHAGNSQQFESNKDGELHLDIIFENGPGSCRVDFYENSSSISNSKTFSW